MPRASRNLAEARLKTLRFYTRFCRLVPFLIRIYGMQQKTTAYEAKKNVAEFLREKRHLRNPSEIDFYVQKAYDALHDCEWKYSDYEHWQRWFMPRSHHFRDRGYSYLEDQKYGKRSTFLKGFYIGNRPN